MLDLILKTIWLLLPAYTPNNFAVLVGGGTPIDFGKNFFDGRRILGDGKTWRGFVGGIAGGVLTANLQYAVETLFAFKIYSSLPYAEFFTLTMLLAAGSMIGDSVGSFFKRRLGYERGARFLIVDQLTFLIVTLFISALYAPFWKLFSVEIILTAILLTPALHLGINYIAFRIGFKEVPW
ncbi:CDP-2,3-bis-(O-geranylgeranyl)-sn-glycerol synthase [Archaeoglobus neptunius]|uniref:CDP-2,3-bis-(O-geranylgeranyl)-sn-glycerol synthase n=1 Tax=Archaeoglobus neptunius TaxID=2798580 RepID=UPI001928EF81|nr:CDP-2,3-bis-(O-geranylgeranyl)-sn-glycerol synthase [Archaeoglobus neptunius]